MIPSQRWFPSSLQDRAAWFNNFATQFAVVGAGLGFTEAEVTAVGADNTAFQKLASITVQLDAYADAVRQFRVVITEGSIGDPNPSFPALPAYTAVTGVSTGIFERLDQLVKRIRVAPSYTDETGALLGIVPAE